MSNLGLDGVTLSVYTVLVVGGVLWSLVCAVLLAMKWKVPPVLATAPLFAHAAAVASLATYAHSQAVTAAATAIPDQKALLLSMAVAQFLSAGLLAPTVIFSAGILGLGALIGGLRGPKWWGLPILSILVFGVAALVPILSVFFDAPFATALGRTVLYGVCAIPAGLAMAGAHPNQSGREAGVVAGVAFVTLVASVEISVLSSAWMRGFAAIALADPSSKIQILAAMQTEMVPLRNAASAAVFLAAVPAALALFRAPMPLSDEEIMNSSVSPSGMRWFGSMLALLLVPLWAITLMAADPTETLDILHAAYKGEVTPVGDPGN